MPKIRPTRREILGGTALFGGALLMPALSRAADRPLVTHGVQTGDIAQDSAVLWARADREAFLTAEWATTESFADAVPVQRLALGEATDYSGKLLLTGLPPGQDVFVRVVMTDLFDTRSASEPVIAHFRTAPAAARDISFVWSGDTAGQGWGIDEARGGMTTYRTMLGHDPDFFIHSGDTVYADGPMKAEVDLKDGTKWRNVLIEQKTKVAETLDEFRKQYLYNMMDANVRAFNARVPMLAQWDDHEVTNNWYWQKELSGDDRYSEKRAAVLAARAMRAFHEMNPIRPVAEEPGRVYRRVSYGPLLDIFFIDLRTYRAANGDNVQPALDEGARILGAVQLDWLKREMKASRALWKVVASDMPIGLIVWDDFRNQKGSEAIAQGDGPALGRELELADLLSFLKRERVQNVVWLTADVHYTAAHRYSPERAQFQDFDAFWEFVSGPLHAGTFGPNALDNTFGPEAVFVKAPTAEQGINLPPSMGLQFFGKVDIAAATGEMTVSLIDSADTVLWSTVIAPLRG
jgi:alkaline phosphatase D